jgi:hypothetical protein
LLLWGRWDATGRGRQDCSVEACRQASHCICPHCVWVVQRTWVMARHACVGVVDVPAMQMTVVPIFKCLEWGGWLQWALAARKSSGLLVRRRGWIASAAGQRLTQCTAAAALLLLQHVDAGGRLLTKHHAILLHCLHLPLHHRDCPALGLRQFLRGGVRNPKVWDRLPIQ